MADASHPYPDPPRQFVAAAMPQGDRQRGVPGPLVMLTETGTRLRIERMRLLSENEARAMRDALSSALRDLECGRRWDAEGKPVASRGHYPFTGHRSLADADAGDGGLSGR